MIETKPTFITASRPLTCHFLQRGSKPRPFITAIYYYIDETISFSLLLWRTCAYSVRIVVEPFLTDRTWLLIDHKGFPSNSKDL